MTQLYPDDCDRGENPALTFSHRNFRLVFTNELTALTHVFMDSANNSCSFCCQDGLI